jgi:hypothetical protein
MIGDGVNLFYLPKTVGFWILPCAPVQFATKVKPRWLTRFLMKHLMQWEWRDA